MPKLSRRVGLLVVGLLGVCVLPVAGLTAVVGRTMFVPPVAGTRFAGYDGLQLDGGCANQPSSRGGQVLVCRGAFRLRSRFAVVEHNTEAVGWCIEQVNESHFAPNSVRRLGPLVLEPFPLIPADWGNCPQMLPVQAGMAAELIFNH